jgi:hypothetical protein
MTFAFVAGMVSKSLIVIFAMRNLLLSSGRFGYIDQDASARAGLSSPFDRYEKTCSSGVNLL